MSEKAFVPRKLQNFFFKNNSTVKTKNRSLCFPPTLCAFPCFSKDVSSQLGCVPRFQLLPDFTKEVILLREASIYHWPPSLFTLTDDSFILIFFVAPQIFFILLFFLSILFPLFSFFTLAHLCPSTIPYPYWQVLGTEHQGFVQARQAPYQVRYILSPQDCFI